MDVNKEGFLDQNTLKPLVRCLPVLHFTTALLVTTPKHVANAAASHESFKVMNKKDIKYLMLSIDRKYIGNIELPEFLVLMDFMRRVDKTPELLNQFRIAVENTLEDHNKVVEIMHSDGKSEEESKLPEQLGQPRKRSLFVSSCEHKRLTAKLEREISLKDSEKDHMQAEIELLRDELKSAKERIVFRGQFPTIQNIRRIKLYPPVC